MAKRYNASSEHSFMVAGIEVAKMAADGYLASVGAGGRVYFVDYDLGSDTANDGLSPGKPFKLLSKAVTAAATWRALQTNIYTRCRIYLIGSSTPQPAVTDLGSYNDIIGIGADPRGDGYGIARIGNLTPAAHAVDISGATSRGLYVENVQFQSGNGYDAFHAAAILRATFKNCTFLGASINTTAMNAGFLATNCAGCRFVDCVIGGGQSMWPVYGMYCTSLTQGIVENCVIGGTTAGIYIGAGSTVWQVIRNNVIGDLGGGCAKGIDDNSNGYAVIAGNMITATDAIEATARGTIRLLGNLVVDTTTPLAEPKHADA